MPKNLKKNQKLKKDPAAKPNNSKEVAASKTVKPVSQAVELDAAGQILGRLSTQVADILRGKNKPDFVPYKAMGEKVLIKNAKNIVVTGNKMTQKIYYQHSGYPGHLKAQTLAEKMRKNPAEVLRDSIFGMLPKNKLRKIWMRNLTILNGEKNAD